MDVPTRSPLGSWYSSTIYSHACSNILKPSIRPHPEVRAPSQSKHCLRSQLGRFVYKITPEMRTAHYNQGYKLYFKCACNRVVSLLQHSVCTLGMKFNAKKIVVRVNSPAANTSSTNINVGSQGKGHQCQCHKNNARDVGDDGHKLGIIQTLDLHSPCLKGQQHSYYLKYSEAGKDEDAPIEIRRGCFVADPD